MATVKLFSSAPSMNLGRPAEAQPTYGRRCAEGSLAAHPSMNILCLCHEYPPIGGGGAAVCAALAHCYASAGHHVTVGTMAHGDLPPHEVSGGVTVCRVPCGRRRQEMSSAGEGLRWAWKTWPLVKRLHARRPFDVTHAHFVMPAGIVAAWLHKSRQVRFVITPHGSDVPGHNPGRLQLEHALARPWWTRICHRANYMVAPSLRLQELIDAAAKHAGSIVIPNGADSKRFRPLPFQHFLSAVAPLELREWRIDLVGDGPMFAHLQDLARRCRMPVRLHGHLTNDSPELARLYGEATIFVLPSERENFSMVLLEAMSAGCAVISTNIAGNREAVGNCGDFVPPNDVGALQEAVSTLVANPDRCRELGRRAAERATGAFDWNVIGNRYLDVLRGVTSRGSRAEIKAA